MKTLKRTTFIIVASLATAQAFADNPLPVSEASKATNITTVMNKRKEPDANFQNKKLFVKFDKSARLSTLIANKLKEKGYDVVDTQDAAEEIIEIIGKFRVHNSEFDTKVKDFADLDEQVNSSEKQMNKADNEASVPLRHVVLSAAATGISQISVTDFALWLSGITGITGSINKFLTGDARGFCLHENCNKTDNSAMLLIKATDLLCDVRVSAKEDRIIIDQVIDKALATSVDCFPTRANSEKP